MSTYFLWAQVVLLIFILAFSGHSLINLWIFRHRRFTEGGGNGARVSVLIPARNEAGRIGPCLESLMQQGEGIEEILVLDDESDDGTGEIVEACRERDGRVRLIPGRERPDGWVGKNWACQQLADAASADFLLFTDADTVHEPDSVRYALAVRERSGADLLSFWPRQKTLTFSEKLLIPFMEILLLVFLPQWMPGRFSTLGAACGQFLMMTRRAYTRMDGHASVSGHLVEDVALARRARGMGLKVVNRDGQRVLSCRMYESWSEIWNGFSKNLRASCDDSLLTFFGLNGFLHLLFLVPFLQVFLWPGLTVEMKTVMLLQFTAIFSMRTVLAVARRHAVVGVMLHPLGQFLWLLITLNSWWVTARGQVVWKGRQYGA